VTQPTHLGKVADIRHRFTAGQPVVHDDIEVLLQALDAYQQAHFPSTTTRSAPDAYAVVVLAYNTLLTALKRAGLDMQQMPPTHECDLPWVWFYCWEGSTKQGPFGTFDAAVGSAILQIRSGVLHKKS